MMEADRSDVAMSQGRQAAATSWERPEMDSPASLEGSVLRREIAVELLASRLLSTMWVV